jgi:hypothetical protein
MNTPRRQRLLFVAGLAIIALAGLFLTSLRTLSPARAAPQPQIPIYTPTAGPDGKIIYIVKANDTLLSISLIMGVPVEQIRALNDLTGDTIYENQKLILGFSGPTEVTLTPGPTPTPTTVLPTPSPKPGSGSLCIILFNDDNGDSIRQTQEESIPGGAISINNRIGSVSLTVDTQGGTDPYCFKNLPEGEYTISVAAPVGYNPTTTNSYSVALKSGDITYVDFGAQANSQTEANATILPSEGQRSPLLGIIGGIFLVVSLLLVIFASRLLKSK